MVDITIFVTSELTSSERRISPSWTVGHFKTRLEQITGIPPNDQRISIFPSTTSSSSESFDYKNLTLLSDIKTLNPLARIHVEDSRPQSELKEIADLEQSSDLSEIRFKYDDKDYESRSDTVLKWKEQNKLGRFDKKAKELQATEAQHNLEFSKTLKLGQRCRIKATSLIEPERRGVIKYIGEIPEIPSSTEKSIWVGVQLDEPLGKNDGSTKGKRYFQCLPKYGSFLKPLSVETGDFPPLDSDLDMDSDIDEEL